MIRSPDFYEWNETVQDLKDSVVQLIEKVDLNAEETKSIQKLVEQLERFDVNIKLIQFNFLRI